MTKIIFKHILIRISERINLIIKQINKFFKENLLFKKTMIKVKTLIKVNNSKIKSSLMKLKNS